VTERATYATDDRRLRDMVARLQESRVLKVTSAVTLTAGTDIAICDTSGGNITVTLPPASTHSGSRFDVKKTIASNTLTVQGSGSDTVDGGASSSWTTLNECRTFVSYIVTDPATWGWGIF
jgi:hypothetical protein